MSLSFNTEAAFRAAYPGSRQYIKANDPEAPCIAIRLAAGQRGNINKPSWVAEGADPSNWFDADEKVVLVNTPIGESYPCEIGANGNPAGYAPSANQVVGRVRSFDSGEAASPRLAIEVTGTLRVNGTLVGEGQVILVEMATGDLSVVDASTLDDSTETAGFIGEAMTFDSEAVWATEPLAADQTFTGLEGEKLFPAGARLAFSETKNLYFITPPKWTKMGYGLVG